MKITVCQSSPIIQMKKSIGGKPCRARLTPAHAPNLRYTVLAFASASLLA